MKRHIYYNSICMLLLSVCTLMMSSCDDDDTYADMKDKEKRAINSFLLDNEFCGPIKVISEEEFLENDTTTDVSKNEFVLFKENGIYMQIVNRGEGKSMMEFAKEQKDSTTTQRILCRFLEYDIEAGATIQSNLSSPSIVDKMQCTYAQKGRSYSASFEEGYMLNKYSTSAVPSGWLQPLKYIRLTRNSGRKAEVRLIVPHSSGTNNASGYVLPMYYEISYQLGN
ncbi:MAG: DUF4827 domain-containing protein [Bacteroidaceae bacterium]|nr:DUF4827 domain-containing protein [Bacteroidaceae bacterium]